MTELNVIWFILLGILLTGYAILDGFDLGVGMLHFVAREEKERQMFIQAIGPIWDGNEVWLVTFGGALLAAFPEAYATIFSGFYLPFMVLLFALMFRAVSVEFRSKFNAPRWRRFSDAGFFGSSLLATLLFGIVAGNGVLGIPLNERGIFIGTLRDLVGPYALLVGALAVSTFAMHGALYLHLKVPHGTTHDRVGRWIWHTWGVFLVFYMLTTIYTLSSLPRAVADIHRWPWAGIAVVLHVLVIANIPRAVFTGRSLQAFASSCLTIAGLVLLLGMAMWPNLVTASNNPANSLTIARAASSPKTLGIMLIIAAIGMPLVLTYTIAIYWTFRHRVDVEKETY